MEPLRSDKKIQLDVISPEKVVTHDSVDYVVLPALQGEAAILPGHADYLTQLSAGEMRIIKDGQLNSLALSGGFARVQNNTIEVFAETAELAEEIDAERARQAAERAKDQIQNQHKKNTNDVQTQLAQMALTRALLRLRVAAKSRKHH